RQMTVDALEGDRIITMVQISPASPGKTWAEPVPIEAVGCLGKIIQHERLSDGRFNLLLLGCKRVRLLHELEGKKLYRSALVEILEDQEPTPPHEPVRSELIGLFRQAYKTHRELDSEMAELLEKPVPLGVLTDLIAHALALSPALKQRLLGESSVDRRAEIIRTVLREIAHHGPSARSFPPPFSIN
ncbi:MAG TPA: LON peptidase substrate-binding domain-containing protein, partial [Isosphaeraceae bacterium]|nr:LON peptidase substrate-binding domain-containing protein [Isosphaeraceae bacterium]